MADYKNEEGETVGTTYQVSVSAGEGQEPLFEKTYPSETAPASGDIVNEAFESAGIEVPGDEVDRVIRKVDVVRENPTKVEQALGLGTPGGWFFGWREKRVFAKESMTEEIEKKKEGE